MPIYEYRCGACEIGFESFQRTIDAPKPVCPQCGKKRRVKRAIGGYAFIKDEATKMREMHPKYAKLADAVWDNASKADPLSKTRFGHMIDSGRRLQDMS